MDDWQTLTDAVRQRGAGSEAGPLALHGVDQYERLAQDFTNREWDELLASI